MSNLWQLVVENFWSFLIGTVFFGSILEGIRRGIDWLLTRRYRGWKLIVTPLDEKRRPYSHDLLWEEVRRFEQSPFENRKFVQSVCTSEGLRIKAGEIDVSQPESWVYRDEARREYRFDFRKMPPDMRA